MPVAYAPLLARIDDRLIHGQVVVGCCEPLGARRILLVDDPVAMDPFQRKLYRAGVPPEVAVEFLTVAQHAEQQAALWSALLVPALGLKYRQTQPILCCDDRQT